MEQPDPAVLEKMKNEGTDIDEEQFVEKALKEDVIYEKTRTISQDELMSILDNIHQVSVTLQFGTVNVETKNRLEAIRDRLLKLVEKANIISQV